METDTQHGHREDMSIRVATRDDLDNIRALQDACRHELGFFGRQALVEATLQRRVLSAYVKHAWNQREEFVGFSMLSAPGNAHRIIVQAAVIPGARRIAIGRRLFDTVEKVANHDGAALLGLSCRSDLQTSLDFWAAMGFSAVRTIPAGESKRACSLVIMRREIVEPLQPLLFTPGVGAGVGRPFASRDVHTKRRHIKKAADESLPLY